MLRKKIIVLLLSTFFIFQCYDHPRRACKRKYNLTLYNLSATASCYNVNYEDEPDMYNHCLVLLYLNLTCNNKPKKTFKKSYKIGFDPTNRKGKNREKRDGRNTSLLFLLDFDNSIKNHYITSKGNNLLELIEYLLKKHIKYTKEDNVSKTSDCNVSGTADTVFNNDVFTVNFHDCKFDNETDVYPSTLLWNGSISGVYKYKDFFSCYDSVYGETISMSGDLSYSGEISSTLGVRKSVNKSCDVSIVSDKYDYYDRIYTFCEKSVPY